MGLGIRYEGPARRFDEQVLTLKDPDGLLLELVATQNAAGLQPWNDGPVRPEHAIRGLHGATIWEDADRGSARFLTETLGFDPVGETEGLWRYQAPDSGLGAVVNLRRASGFWSGSGGVGTVHHMAFRASTDAEQLEQRAAIESQGLGVTPVVDRQYFRSVYFREPGGVLYEIATDGPGFTIDESAGELGTHLRLPPMYEEHRTEIERALPALRLPQVPAGQAR